MEPAPPLTRLDQLPGRLLDNGWAVPDSASLCQLAQLGESALQSWPPLWGDLPADAHLRDGGRYPRRRHVSMMVWSDRVAPAHHRAHWQPVAYNALHGGFERWFEPLCADALAGRDTLVLTYPRGGFQGPAGNDSA